MTSISLEDYETHVCAACCAILSHGDGSATMVRRRVANLLSQNIPPSDAEAHDLQHTDLDLAPYTAQIHQRMDELTDEMARLTIARACLESHPHHVKGILHPMRSLPEDVLREIFLWSTEGDEEVYKQSEDSLYPRRPQWVLSQVCRRWRDIILAFPRLWSSLYLNLGHPYIDPSPMSPSILRLTSYLDRSANQKMTVHISMNELCWFVDFVDFGPLLRESTSRWVDCRLYTSFEFVDDILSDCNFDSLISLCLELYPDSSADIAPQAKKLDAFMNTPLLRSLDYRNEFHQEYPVLLPWGQLTSMEVAAPALSDAFALGPFKTLTNVQRLTLHLSSLDLETDTLLFLSHNPLQLPSLTSLCLSRLAEEDAQTGEFISCLEMPALTELELVFEWLPSTDSEDDEDIASRITFPHFHSSVDLGQLKILSITFPYEDDPDGVDKLVAFLCLVPNLHELWLCHYDIPSAVFDALTLKNGHSEILPYLQLLNFSGSGFAGDVGITHVLSMLESRCPLPGRETNGPSVLTQLILFPYAVQHIATMCVNDEIRGRWDDLCTSMLVISR